MDYNLLQLKELSPYQLRCLLFSSGYPLSPFFPPQELLNPYLTALRLLPKNLVQLNDRTIQWITQNWIMHQYSGLSLHIIYEHNLDFFLDNTSNIPITFVFFETGLKNRQRIIDKLNAKEFFFYTVDDKTVPKINAPDELPQMLKRDCNKIMEHFRKYGDPVQFDFNHQIPPEFANFNQEDPFIPSLNNHCILNQYIGNRWHEYDSIKKYKTDDQIIEDVARMGQRTERMLILNNQIDKIDHFRIPLLNDNPQHLPGKVEDFTPLIVVAPFQYPKIEDVFSDEFKKHPTYALLIKLYKSEQDNDYRGRIDASKFKNPEEMLDALKITTKFLADKSLFLDNVSYLHATFTYSPVLRLPIKGTSLNKHISIFNPDTSLPVQKKLYRTIQQFGEAYVKETMHPEVIKQFIVKNRQLVCISDLPVEWFNIEGVPLSFSHDVCRIPELPYGGILATYLKNQMVKYTVPKDILSKTLVLLGTPTKQGHNKAFDNAFKIVEANRNLFGYQTMRCDSAEDAQIAIEKYKPELLIIDTHGKTLKEDKTSLLQFGKNWIGGDEIIRRGIAAPLMILSACSTIPNWGYYNPISNAFLEAGALTVTGTFLPIGVYSGTILYQRVLHNLKTAANKPIHHNWLNYMSHCIRTIYMTEIQSAALQQVAKMKLRPAQYEKLILKIRTLTSNLLRSSMLFHVRRSIFKDVIDEYNKLHKEIKVTKSLLSMEQLLYTNIGRSDLIMFQSWLNEQSTDPSIKNTTV